MRLDLNCSFADKEKAKKYGAKWDKDNKTWYIDDEIQDKTKFKRWLMQFKEDLPDLSSRFDEEDEIDKHKYYFVYNTRFCDALIYEESWEGTDDSEYLHLWTHKFYLENCICGCDDCPYPEDMLDALSEKEYDLLDEAFDDDEKYEIMIEQCSKFHKDQPECQCCEFQSGGIHTQMDFDHDFASPLRGGIVLYLGQFKDIFECRKYLKEKIPYFYE